MKASRESRVQPSAGRTAAGPGLNSSVLPRCWTILVAALAVGFFACTPAPSWASDYVFVVDTSGSMIGPVSRAKPDIRIKVVQSALRDFCGRLPLGSRVYLMSFSTGITSELERYIRTELDRQLLYRWIDALEEEARKNGATYLCSSLRKALMIASTYAADHSGEPVTVWALTDGGDNEPGPGTESGTPQRLKQVLADFPNIDGSSVRADLTVLGDLALTITSEKNWFVVGEDNFKNVVPPVIEFSPPEPKVSELVTFLDNSASPYQFYEWRVDGLAAGYTRTIRTSFNTPGAHIVRLNVKADNGRPLTTVKRITIGANERPVADFVVVPGSPEPGQKVQCICRQKGAPLSLRWFINGQQFSTNDVAEYVFPQEGKFGIKLRVEDQAGLADEKQQTVAVVEPALSVGFSADAEAKDGQPVRFANETTGGKAAGYEWDFGDGAKSTQQNPSHAFSVQGTEPKTFSVGLRATTRLGKSHTSAPFLVKVWPAITIPKPKAAFSVSTNRVRQGLALQFINHSTGVVDRVTWRFAQEAVSTDPSPLFAFSTFGSKEVSLAVAGPGGSDAASMTITVVKPESIVRLEWIDSNGQQAPPPSSVDFGHVHPVLARSGDYRPPPFDSFDVLMPPDLPPDGGLALTFDENAAKGLQLVRLIPNSQSAQPATGLVRESGRYRLSIRTNAPEADCSGHVTFKPQGGDILLAVLAGEMSSLVSTNSVDVPVNLSIGATSSAASVLLVPVALAAVGFLAWIVLRKRRLVYPVELVLEETEPTGKVNATGGAVARVPPMPLTLEHTNDVVSLGNDPHLPDQAPPYDLNAPNWFIIAKEKTLELCCRSDGSARRLRSGDCVSVSDATNLRRMFKVTFHSSQRKHSESENLHNT
jgi:PKD repeat protein